MVVNDLDKTLAFYERLGFEIAWEDRPNNRPRMPTIRIGGAPEDQRARARVAGSPGIPGRAAAVGRQRRLLPGWDGTVQEVLDLLAKNGITPEAGPARARAPAAPPPASTSAIPTTTSSSSPSTDPARAQRRVLRA